MPWFSPFWARIARYTALVLVGFLLLYASAWKGWIFRSDRQELPRRPDPAAIAVPAGYKVEVLASGLNAPSALEVTKDGQIFLGESGYGGAYAATAGYEGATPGRILKLNPDGMLSVVAGGFLPPLAGFAHDDKGTLYVSHNGTITSITAAGDRREILTGLPSMGDHKNNNIALGPDGKLYLTQGTVTNSGIVGLDNYVLWGRFFPGPRDIPCRDVTLRGVNVTTADPRSVIPFMRVTTGAYSPFGTATVPGQVIKGQLPCGGAVMRVGTDGKGLELVAWGLRNPFDLKFDGGGQLWVTDAGLDTRGSRPLDGEDLLQRIRPGAWYGWPDYWNGKPANTVATGRGRQQLLLAKLPAKPEGAYLTFDEHAMAAGFDFAPAAFGFDGQMFVAQWGTGFPATSQEPWMHGFNVLRVNLSSRQKEVFAVNRPPGPASLTKSRGGFERPVAVRFGPDGAMYVLDWGHMAVTRKGPWHVPDTGVLWRISKVGTQTLPFAYRPSPGSGEAVPTLSANPNVTPGQAGAGSLTAPPPTRLTRVGAFLSKLASLRLVVATHALGAAGLIFWRGWHRRRH